jgi:hypothetical protein
MRVFAAALLSLGLAASPLLAKNAGETGKEDTPAAVTSPSAAADKPAAVKPEASAIESEVDDLRSLVEEQRAELESQRAALKAQQLKMESLEEKLGATPAEPTTTPATAPAATQPASLVNSAITPSTTAAHPVSAKSGWLTEREAELDQEAGAKLSDLAYGKIHIGGTFYGDWAYYTDTGFGPQFLTQLNQDGPGNNGFNSFDITRTYLNFFFTPDEAVTLRITPNIYRQVDAPGTGISNGSGSGINGSSNGNLGFRLKYAYVDFNTLFKGSTAFKKDKLTAGQTTNPLVDWEEGLWGYRYVSLTPWNYLSLSSTYTGITLHGPIEFNGKEYLDYHIGVFNTASFHSIETNDKKQAMIRVTWYPLGTTADRTGLGITGFEDYGYNTKTPDAVSTPLDRVAVLAHYQTHSKSLLIAGEYDWGRNAFSTGNLFSGAAPGDAVGLGPTPYATFNSLAGALLAGTHTRQRGFDFFGHVKLGHSPFSLFGFFEQFQPNTAITVTNPLDFRRTVGGLTYKFNNHFELSIDDQNLTYYHPQFTMTQAQINSFSPSLATTVGPAGIPNAVPNSTNAIFINLLFNY